MLGTKHATTSKMDAVALATRKVDAVAFISNAAASKG